MQIRPYRMVDGWITFRALSARPRGLWIRCRGILRPSHHFHAFPSAVKSDGRGLACRRGKYSVVGMRSIQIVDNPIDPGMRNALNEPHEKQVPENVTNHFCLPRV